MSARRLKQLSEGVSRSGPDDVAYDGLRVLQHPERFRQFLVGRPLDITPVTVQLWPTLSCNASCPTCAYRLNGSLSDGHESLRLMDFDYFQGLVGSLAEAGVRSVFLTGGGEPLLHPDIALMASTLGSSGLSWGLFTNGLRLSAELATQLLHASPGFFRVSLDAGSPDLHSRTYGTSMKDFAVVKSNIVGAGRIALEMGRQGFGVGFALLPNVTTGDLADIRTTLRELFENSGLGVNFVSFRPRVLHYRNGAVVCPQPWAGRYRGLADAIRSYIVRPLAELYGPAVRFDHKYGAFVDCDRLTSPRGGWGGAWITTIDHTGQGSLISHLAGGAANPSSWGDACALGSFAASWCSEKRKRVHQRLLTGEIPLPVAHGFRALDAFLDRVVDAIRLPLSEAESDAVVASIDDWNFRRSARAEFVG